MLITNKYNGSKENASKHIGLLITAAILFCGMGSEPFSASCIMLGQSLQVENQVRKLLTFKMYWEA